MWFERGKARYVCGQLERGEEGTPHIQYTLNFKEPVRKTALIKHCKFSHYTQVKRDNGAGEYCMKEDTRVDGPWEFGTRPVKRDSKEDWARVRRLAERGDMEAIPDDIYVKHYGNLQRIRKDHCTVRGQADDCKGVWIHGPSGCGKSSYARFTYPYCYQKLANRWWDGYQGEEVVLLEDMDPSTSEALVRQLKIWADRYHCPGETKGGMIALNYTRFIVTSQYTPEEAFANINERDKAALLRRFKVVDFQQEHADWVPQAPVYPEEIGSQHTEID